MNGELDLNVNFILVFSIRVTVEDEQQPFKQKCAWV